MKMYQWASIMWGLCMISYYLSGKAWLPLIVAVLFGLLGVLDILLPRPEGKK